MANGIRHSKLNQTWRIESDIANWTRLGEFNQT